MRRARELERERRNEQQQKDFTTMRELRIIFIGKTGTGKSTTGNNILGGEEFIDTEGFKSGTAFCKSAERVFEQERLLVVDTPGFLDSAVPEEITAKAILASLAFTCPGPHVFLWTFHATSRFYKADFDMFSRMKELFGPGFVHRVVVVFTHINEFKGNFKEALSKAPDDMKSVLTEVGHRYVSVDNSKWSDSDMTEIMSRIKGVLDSNKGDHFSNTLIRRVSNMVHKEMCSIMEREHCSFEEASKKYAEELKTGYESKAMRNLFATFGKPVLGALVGGAAGGYAVGGPLGAGVGATVGAVVAARYEATRKWCSIS